MTEQERQALALSSLFLARRMAGKFIRWQSTRWPGRDDHDEIGSEARLALCRAARKYDPTRLHNGRPIRFTTFAHRVIWMHLIDWSQRQTGPCRRPEKMTIPLHQLTDRQQPLANRREIDLDEIEGLAGALEKLDRVERAVALRYIAWGELLSDVAAELGMHRKTAYLVRRRAVAKLRAYYGVDDDTEVA